MGDYPPQYYSSRGRKYYRKRPSVAGGGGGGAVGSWKELGRTTLGNASSSINVTSLADKRYLLVLSDLHGISGGNTDHHRRYNSDSGSNYSNRYSYNGGSDTTGINQTNQLMGYSITSAYDYFSTSFIANYSSKEKLIMLDEVNANASGSSNVPRRTQFANKWTNTSNSISSINTFTDGAQTYGSGSEVVVLGYDPADTHTTNDNFWQELASVNATGSTTSFDTGVFTAKKYLWVQCFVSPSAGGNIGGSLRLGNTTIDTGNNYGFRYSENGGADGTVSSSNYGAFLYTGSASPSPIFFNMFIINNASKEKQYIINMIENVTSGSSNSPDRIEQVGKYTNTSSQINIIQYYQTVSNISSNSVIKVWGAD